MSFWRLLGTAPGYVPWTHVVASGSVKGDGEAGGGSQGRGGAQSGTMGDDDNAARRPSGGRAAGWRSAGHALAQPARYAALVAGVLPVLAFPAPSLGFLGWFGLVPGLLLMRGAPSAREAAVRAWWFGAGFIMAAHYWLIPNIGPALLLVAIVLGACWAGVGVSAWALLRPPMTAGRCLAALVVVPSFWLLVEWIRSWQALGGPWALLGE